MHDLPMFPCQTQRGRSLHGENGDNSSGNPVEQIDRLRTEVTDKVVLESSNTPEAGSCSRFFPTQFPVSNSSLSKPIMNNFLLFYHN